MEFRWAGVRGDAGEVLDALNAWRKEEVFGRLGKIWACGERP